MSKKIKIGITQRVDRVEFYGEYRDALDQRLINWVAKLGFVPIPIPNVLVDVASSSKSQLILDNWLSAVRIDAILLSGGNDIGDVDQRDLTEKCLLSWAEDNNKPVLGICRGMQMMGVYADGELIKVDGHVNSRHQLKFKDGQDAIFQKNVNSYHNLSLKECPDSYQILAKSEDNCIEAIKHKELSWEGWMWHPEREDPYNNADQARFKKLVNNEK